MSRSSPATGAKSAPNPAPTGIDLPLWAVGAYLILAAIVLFYSFAEHPACLFTGTDGHVVQDVMSQARLFRRAFSQEGVAPLSGMFDANWPENRDYFFSELVSVIVAGGTPSKPLSFALCSIFVTACLYVLARAVGAARSVALAAGMLVPVVIMPVFQGEPSLAYLPLFNIDPYFSQGIALWLLFVAALWRLEGRWNAASIACFLLPTVCGAWMVLASAPMVIVMAPCIAAYGGASLFERWNWRWNLQRLIAAILIVPVALACGFFTYQIGLYRYTAYADFSGDFITPAVRRSLTFVSLAFEGRIGQGIVALAYIGGVYSIFAGPRRLRVVAAAFLVATTLFLTAGYYIMTRVPDYHGISPSYFESYLLPTYLLFGVLAVTGVAATMARIAPSRWRERLALCGAYLLPALVVGGVVAWNIARAGAPDTLHCQRAGLPNSLHADHQLACSESEGDPGETLRRTCRDVQQRRRC